MIWAYGSRPLRAYSARMPDPSPPKSFLFIVSEFREGQWHEVLRTKDEAKARDLFEALGARGKLEELKPRLKPLRSCPHLRLRRHVIICSACRDILATVAARIPSRRGQVAGSGSPCLRRTFGLAAAPPQRRGCVLY